jgi:hypothetical protein
MLSSQRVALRSPRPSALGAINGQFLHRLITVFGFLLQALPHDPGLRVTINDPVVMALGNPSLA